MQTSKEKGVGFSLEGITTIALLVYIVSAIAFESTPNTARISTIAIYLLFGVGVVFILFSRTILVSQYLIFQILMFGWICIMTLASSSYTAQTIFYANLTCTVLCVIVFLIAVRNRHAVQWILLAYVVGAFILMVRIILAYGGVSALIQYVSREGEYRVGELVTNENTIGLLMGNGVLCCITYILAKLSKNRLITVVMLVLAGAFAAMLFLAGSKKAVAFIACGFLALTFYASRGLGPWKRALVFAAVIALGLGVLAIIQNVPMFYTINLRVEQMINTLLGQDGASSSDQVRIEMITQGWNAFLSSPIWGNGAGYSYVLFRTYSHNNFIELLMCYGIVGFLLFYVPYVTLIWKLLKKARERDMIAIYFLVYTLLQIILAIGWVNYYERTTQLITAAAWGYVLYEDEASDFVCDEFRARPYNRRDGYTT